MLSIISMCLQTPVNFLVRKLDWMSDILVLVQRKLFFWNASLVLICPLDVDQRLDNFEILNKILTIEDD